MGPAKFKTSKVCAVYVIEKRDADANREHLDNMSDDSAASQWVQDNSEDDSDKEVNDGSEDDGSSDEASEDSSDGEANAGDESSDDGSDNEESVTPLEDYGGNCH